MWGVLRRPRWLGYLALAVIFGVVTANLGLWQWHRHEQKLERRALVEANYGGEPVPLDDVLPGPEPVAGGDVWTRVEATGTYQVAEQHLVRNRPRQGVYGYEVVVPLLLDDGTVLAVDRGWVPNAATAQALPDVPPAPEGEVRVEGWLRATEPDLGRDRVDGQLASVSLEELAEATGDQLRGGYLILDSEEPAPAQRPAPLDAPDTGLGSHLAYALQWWLTVPVGLVLVLVMARREAADERAAGSPGIPGDTGSPPEQPRRARPRKVRIWDEEDA